MTCFVFRQIFGIPSKIGGAAGVIEDEITTGSRMMATGGMTTDNRIIATAEMMIGSVEAHAPSSIAPLLLDIILPTIE